VVAVEVVVTAELEVVLVELPLSSEATTARATPSPTTIATSAAIDHFTPRLIPPGGGSPPGGGPSPSEELM
jgi:hypothetical protein